MLMLSTTTVTITRPDPNDEPYETPGTPETIAADVRAHIGQERGSSSQQGTQQETVTWRLDCDPVDLIHGDVILDQQTGLTYRCEWVRPRQGLGLDHMEASLIQVSQRNPAGV